MEHHIAFVLGGRWPASCCVDCNLQNAFVSLLGAGLAVPVLSQHMHSLNVLLPDILHAEIVMMAFQAGAHLVVLNLSQQTDSSDLLGGFRPVEARDALAPLLPAFNDLVRWDGRNPWQAPAALDEQTHMQCTCPSPCQKTRAKRASRRQLCRAQQRSLRVGKKIVAEKPSCWYKDCMCSGDAHLEAGQQRGLPGPRRQAGRPPQVGAAGGRLPHRPPQGAIEIT